MKRILHKTLVQNAAVRAIFKSKPRRPKSPAETVAQTISLLTALHSFDDQNGTKRFDKMGEIDTLMHEMKSILYGNAESVPAAEACSQLTQEFFKHDTLRLIINCLPKLNLEARKDAAQVVANLQSQPVNSCLIASDYLAENLDILDNLIIGYEDSILALHYGSMLKKCIRHQVVARYVLKPEHVKRFFGYVQVPEFDVAADATSTFEELLTRHKSTVAEFLSENYDWFFAEFNAQLLESPNYITRRQAVKLLGEILLDRSNCSVMVRYVSSLDNMMILMNLLRETSKSIQLDAFHVFKLFVANKNRPAEIASVLANNKDKLLRLLEGLKTDKEDEIFETDKAEIMKEITQLDSPGQSGVGGDLFSTPFSSSEALQGIPSSFEQE
ncbi:putative MO25-like protein At5g47540 isoform X2 [Ipomoea triloba]|uniref:putative MO25-like protein At5g47540 isoform X2 n=2 Tax=Ipomoea triloba TaxID=35885 RepID=UPI00125D6CE1|nr:putative MO25-like protein At5g47540 isoform X2 [Ipomoea triloba]